MLLIKNGCIHTMDKKHPVYADILIVDKKIEKIEKNIEQTEAMQVLDAKNMLIFPGFIDAHSHIGISTEKTTHPVDESNEGTNPITPQIRALDAINPFDPAFHNALAVGITGVMTGPGSANAIGGQFAFIKTDGRSVDEMVVKSPSAIKIAFGENPITNYGLNGNMPSTRMGVASLIRKELYLAKDYIDKGRDFDFSYECYRDLFLKKIPLKAHVHRADDILTAIRIAKEFDLKLTLDHCTEGHLIIEQIKASGYPCIVGPSFSSRSKDEVACADFKTAGILSKAGITVAITMDHPVSRIHHLPLAAAMCVKEGMDEFMALSAITINAAKICGVDDTLGSIAIGKDADLVIYDRSPFDIFANALYTIINGKIVWQKDK